MHEGYLVVDDAENWPLWWPLLAGRDPELPLDFTAQDYEENGNGLLAVHLMLHSLGMVYQLRFGADGF